MSKSGGSKENITIESFGGNGGLITGSCHKLSSRDNQIMVDLGLFQGLEERSKRGEQRNLGLKDVDFKGVSDVLLTHSHVDHCGRLPMAFKKGFRFDIYGTEANIALTEQMLINSGEIQEQQLPNKRLYEHKDVEATLRYLKVVKPFEEFNIGNRHSKITGEFLPNGHILGSASVLIRDKTNPNRFKDIFFSGDIGKPFQSLTGGYADFANQYPDDPIHAMVLESTNFEKDPIPFKDKEKELISTFEKIWNGGGNVLLPVLSLHRSQEIMEMLHNLQNSGQIPGDCKIFIDAPLAVKLTGIYENLASEYFLPRYGDNNKFYKTEEKSLSRLDLKNLTIINSHDQSVENDKNMASYDGKAIILASGGMFCLGRSMNYRLGDFCKNPKNGVVFTCFQVNGTFGSSLLYQEYDKELRQDNLTHDKKGRLIGAQVFKVDGFTSHASGEELINFVERFNLDELKVIDIGHGKESSRQKMAKEFQARGYKAKIMTPDIGEKIEVYV
jgi:metallo-beta-lactamase family protein